MVEKVSQTAREKILRKTPYAHSVRPSDDGMSAGQVKKMFYQAITDREDSALAEVDRVVDEVNAHLDLKADKASVVDYIDREAAGDGIASALAVVTYCDRAQNTYRLYFTDVEIPASAWEEDDTLENFGYRAFVPLPLVDDSMIPEVFFSAVDAVPGKGLGNICDTADGGIYVYAMYLPQETVTIDAVYLNTPNVYNVVVEGDEHLHITVRDEDKEYHSGDFVIPGTVLTVAWQVDEGYTATVKVGHQVATSPTVVTVAGTVWVQGTVEEVVNEG